MESSKQNDLAQRLKQLCKPGDPLILTNVYDAATASIVAAHLSTTALATASFAFAATRGIKDEELTFEINLESTRVVASALAMSDLPLSVDIQDGYGDVASTVQKFIEIGAAGCNIEDLRSDNGKLWAQDAMISRIKTAIKAAEAAGVPDFCINARTDTLVLGGSLDEAVARGKAYLAAGATTVYVWGGPRGRGVSKDEVKVIVDKLGGMVNVKMNLRPGFLNAKELAELGVARISVGPELYNKAMAGFKDALEVVAKKESFPPHL